MMIANARMYSVSPQAADAWGRLLTLLSDKSGVSLQVIAHAEPEPIAALWERSDMGAVFMCGLPFSRAQPQPVLVAAPVPSPSDFEGRPCYWSDFVVRADSGYRTVQDTLGTRIALTVPDSQSGCVAALTYFMDNQRPAAAGGDVPPYLEIIAPTVTPLGSLRAVLQGAADIAPIDSYAHKLLRQYRPDLTSQVRIVGRTAATPIPPLVASGPGVDTLQAAFLECEADAEARSLMAELLLQRFLLPDPAAYAVLRRSYEAAMRYWSARRFAQSIPPAFRFPAPS
jgi:ABC-type phosphate/phosphonate transport system substrate-binding protein